MTLVLSVVQVYKTGSVQSRGETRANRASYSYYFVASHLEMITSATLTLPLLGGASLSLVC